MSIQNNTPSNMLKAALYYKNKFGFSVIPIAPGKKSPPLVEWEEFQNRKATDEEITEWWTKTPDANIAIITGKISNLAVVDFDKYDPKYSEDTALEYFPDTILTPSVATPGGGTHLYFQSPNEGLRNNARALPGIDLRAEGGYVAAPPSVNGNGKRYEWLVRPDCTFENLPDGYLSYINKKAFCIYRGGEKTNEQVVTSVTSCDKMFNKGTRDQDLFHTANCLVKGGMQQGNVRQVLEILANNCNPPFPISEAEIKIKSALERSARRERNLQAEVDSYIVVTSGYFSVTDCYNVLQVVTKEDKAAVRTALNRRKGKTIEKYGKKDGVYQRIDTELEMIDFTEDEGARSAVLLPLDLHELVDVCEGNIVLVAGGFNSGKTSFALNVLQMNKNRMRIRYLSSEMKGGEFKRRWRTFGLPNDFWLPDEMTEYVALKNNLGGSILPDGLNIVDYLEFPDGDFTQGAEYMRQVHDKLTTGVAIVCIQQKENAKLPRSGDLVMEKPRLAISFKKIPTDTEDVWGVVEIQKAKNVRLGKCDGKKLEFQLTHQGSHFKVIRPWGWWKDYGR